MWPVSTVCANAPGVHMIVVVVCVVSDTILLSLGKKEKKVFPLVVACLTSIAWASSCLLCHRLAVAGTTQYE